MFFIFFQSSVNYFIFTVETFVSDSPTPDLSESSSSYRHGVQKGASKSKEIKRVRTISQNESGRKPGHNYNDRSDVSRGCSSRGLSSRFSSDLNTTGNSSGLTKMEREIIKLEEIKRHLEEHQIRSQSTSSQNSNSNNDKHGRKADTDERQNCDKNAFSSNAGNCGKLLKPTCGVDFIRNGATNHRKSNQAYNEISQHVTSTRGEFITYPSSVHGATRNNETTSTLTQSKSLDDYKNHEDSSSMLEFLNKAGTIDCQRVVSEYGETFRKSGPNDGHQALYDGFGNTVTIDDSTSSGVGNDKDTAVSNSYYRNPDQVELISKQDDCCAYDSDQRSRHAMPRMTAIAGDFMIDDNLPLMTSTVKAKPSTSGKNIFKKYIKEPTVAVCGNDIQNDKCEQFNKGKKQSYHFADFSRGSSAMLTSTDTNMYKRNAPQFNNVESHCTGNQLIDSNINRENNVDPVKLISRTDFLLDDPKNVHKHTGESTIVNADCQETLAVHDFKAPITSIHVANDYPNQDTKHLAFEDNRKKTDDLYNKNSAPINKFDGSNKVYNTATNEFYGIYGEYNPRKNNVGFRGCTDIGQSQLRDGNSKLACT